MGGMPTLVRRRILLFLSKPLLSELEYEILDLVVQEDETTALILSDLRNPNNAAWFSAEAKALDFALLDAVFGRLADLGLVSRKEESTDGFALSRPGVTYTWWSMTSEGRRVRDAWANAPAAQ